MPGNRIKGDGTPKCQVPDCNKKKVFDKRSGRYIGLYCSMHRQRLLRHGSLNLPKKEEGEEPSPEPESIPRLLPPHPCQSHEERVEQLSIYHAEHGLPALRHALEELHVRPILGDKLDINRSLPPVVVPDDYRNARLRLWRKRQQMEESALADEITILKQEKEDLQTIIDSQRERLRTAQVCSHGDLQEQLEALRVEKETLRSDLEAANRTVLAYGESKPIDPALHQAAITAVRDTTVQSIELERKIEWYRKINEHLMEALGLALRS